jgi:hypothetical protein
LRASRTASNASSSNRFFPDSHLSATLTYHLASTVGDTCSVLPWPRQAYPRQAGFLSHCSTLLWLIAAVVA